jgi:PS-10 peptidase S37
LRKTLVIILLLSLIIGCDNNSTGPDNRDLLEKLQSLPDIEVMEQAPPFGFDRAFEIKLQQPIDHNNPGGIKFTQTFYLSHKDESKPMVLALSGYGITRNAIFEETQFLDANQIYVGHRYLPGALPTRLDWQYLTIEQAAGDHHEVITRLKTIYEGKWLSRGASKGGMTALFHRRFHPGDIDATVAKVAPLPFAAEDPRFDTFLEDVVGDEACRNKLIQFQRDVLINRDDILPHLNSYLSTSTYTYSMDPDLILDYMVLEYPFAFWQYGIGDCNLVPDESAPAIEVFNSLSSVVGTNFYSDEIISYYEPVYYQAFTEFGYYGLMTDHVADLLDNPEIYSYANFTPLDATLVFKPEVMADIVNWLQTEGDNIIYIYGSQDPWTAGAIEHTGTTNSIKIVQQGGNHGLTIAGLDDRNIVYNALELWMGVSIGTVSRVMAPAFKFEDDKPAGQGPRTWE